MSRFSQRDCHEGNRVLDGAPSPLCQVERMLTPESISLHRGSGVRSPRLSYDIKVIHRARCTRSMSQAAGWVLPELLTLLARKSRYRHLGSRSGTSSTLYQHPPPTPAHPCQEPQSQTQPTPDPSSDSHCSISSTTSPTTSVFATKYPKANRCPKKNLGAVSVLYSCVPNTARDFPVLICMAFAVARLVCPLTLVRVRTNATL